MSNLNVSDFISDHRALHVSLTCSRAHPERKQIEVRSLKRIIYNNNKIIIIYNICIAPYNTIL